MERKKAIITGASRGIGRGIALYLTAQGYDVAISYHSKRQEALTVAAAIKENGGNCHCFEAHLEEDGAGSAFFQKAVKALGGLDLLVNNAGVTIFESILDMTAETMDKLINLDFKNYLVLMKAAANHMVEHNTRGSIVNITSSRSERAYPKDALYGGLKAGLNRAIQSIALDLAPYGIRVNNIAPGAIRVRTTDEIPKDGTIPANFWDELDKKIPLGRSGEPMDVAQAVYFLASEQASYITGITLRVDGGLILPGMPEQSLPGIEYQGWGYTEKRKEKQLCQM